jgi:hypothetical protein
MMFAGAVEALRVQRESGGAADTGTAGG